MSARSEREKAREVVVADHRAALTERVTHVADATDRFREGDLDAFEVDHALFQYSRAAKELWKFCNTGDIGFTAILVKDQPPIDWWERGSSKER